MEQFDKYRIWLDPKREKKLLDYVADRRYRFMMTLYLSGAAAVLGAPLAIYDMGNLKMDGGAVPLPDMEMLLAGRYGRYRYIPGSLFISWVIDIILFLFLFLSGIGRQFGAGSDYYCVAKQKYICHTMRVSGVDAGCTKHPYRIFDELGEPCICPVFLDYKHAEIGVEMLCITLDNGHKYAMALDNVEFF
jgi:hypothetical protein